MTHQVVLYLQPEDIADALGANMADTIKRFFSLDESDRRFPVIQELLDNMMAFSHGQLSECGVCALFTVTVDVHFHNVTQAKISFEELEQFSAKRLSEYAIELPPLFKQVISEQELQVCGEFIENYLWNYKFYRYLFKPQNLLKVSTQGAIELTQIESLTQLGYL